MDDLFIRMCDCPEIQEQWEPKEWDLYLLIEDKLIWAVLPGDIADSGVYGRVYVEEGFFEDTQPKVVFDCSERSDYIWLPTQSQLQKMVGSLIQPQTHHYGNIPFIGGDSGEINLPSEYKQCNSWEQLWLAFVMKEKHDKTWDGEKWKKEE